MTTFAVQVGAFAAKAGARADLVRKKVALEILTRVVLKTPVDTGRARGNWQVGESAIGQQTSTLDPGGTAAIEAGGALINATPPEQTSIFITNSLPYIEVLENGGYPNPAKTGDKTVGGYSRQAPQGMVRTTLVEFRDILGDAVKETAS